MSDPMKSLKHFRRPFRNKTALGQYDFPRSEEVFNVPSLKDMNLNDSDSDLNELIDEVTSTMAMKSLKNDKRSCSSSRFTTECKPLTEDADLINKLLSRIKQLELAKMYNEKVIKEKDLRINVLEDKVALYQKVKDIQEIDSNKYKQLQNQYDELSKQVEEMEEFLSDYGLVWVGGDEGLSEKMFNVNTSRNLDVDQNFGIDYDKIIKNVSELNMMVKAEESQIAMTGETTAQLKSKESLILTLYANGIDFGKSIRRFRSFIEESTKVLIGDISDGFYPSEIEDEYPFGVPIDVRDKRNVHYDVKTRKIFQGPGRTLGGENVESKLLIKSTKPEETGCQVLLNKIPSSDKRIATLNDDNEQEDKVTVNEFLTRLPSCTITNEGKIISIRSSIQNVLEGKTNLIGSQNSCASNEASVNQPDVNSDDVVSDSSSLASIKVVCPLRGRQFKFVMKTTDTLEMLYEKFGKLSSRSLDTFVLVTNYPFKKLEICSRTLLEVGLVPNATLLVEYVK